LDPAAIAAAAIDFFSDKAAADRKARRLCHRAFRHTERSKQGEAQKSERTRRPFGPRDKGLE
jgi:hypothetical protein